RTWWEAMAAQVGLNSPQAAHRRRLEAATALLIREIGALDGPDREAASPEVAAAQEAVRTRYQAWDFHAYTAEEIAHFDAEIERTLDAAASATTAGTGGHDRALEEVTRVHQEFSRLLSVLPR